MLIQMVKTYAGADHVLDTGKVYDLPESFASELLKDNACVPYRASQLPRSKKAKDRLMPDSRPDPQYGNGTNKLVNPVADPEDDEDEDA